MAINKIADVIDAELNGKVRNFIWRKTPSQATTAGLWFDLSMSPGNPLPKYWFDAPPLIAKTITQTADGGLYHGPNVFPEKKYLRIITTMSNAITALPMNMLLCDYLLYYPSIDEGTTDAQILTNSVTLPRYTDGTGVQILPVSIAARTGGQSFYVTYTNQDGVSGRVSQTIRQNTSTALGVIVGSNTSINNASNPFIGLQSGDTGVRQIDSVVMLGNDVGLFSLILVKPLAQIISKEIIVPYEKDFLMVNNDLIRIYDDAFLNFLCLPNGALNATTLTGNLKCIWS